MSQLLTQEDILKIRKDFPNLETKVHGKDLIYFDNAATTLKCRSTIEALNKHYSHETSNVHRGVHHLSEMATTKFEATRITTQEFINARNSHEIIFTKGTTDSINLVASSFGEYILQKGDIILLSTMEHHSNIVPWQLIAKKTGAEVKEIPITDEGEINEEEFKKLLNEKVKIVSMAHISNTLGTINPIKKYIEWVHEKNAYFVVDAAQSAAHEKIDVQDLDCDFLAFSAHKAFGPTGVGILYGKEKHLEAMPPYQGGGAMIHQVTFEKTTFNDLPNKFEAGTPHIAGVIAFKYALDFLSQIGLSKIKQYEHELLEQATRELNTFEKLKIIGQSKEKASVISFTIEDVHPHDMGTLLDKQGIAIRTGHHCTQPLMKRFGVTATARASFSLYNTTQEVEKFIDGLRKVQTFF